MQLSGEAAVSGDLLLIALLRADDELRGRLEAMGLRLDRLEAAVLPVPGPPIEVEEEEPGRPPHLIATNISTPRILDACANRAREGLRIVEDYCRFVLDDAFLCGELKQLRHDLTAALAGLPATIARGARREAMWAFHIHASGGKGRLHSPPSRGELEAVARGVAQPGRVRQNSRSRLRPGDGTVALSHLHAGTGRGLGAAARTGWRVCGCACC